MSDGDTYWIVSDAIFRGFPATQTVTGSYPVCGPTYNVQDCFLANAVLTYPDGLAPVAAANVPDPDGVYFVLTSPDITQSGFCTSFCGWHTHASISGVNTKYAFVGDSSTQCLGSCSAVSVPAPNGDAGADAMASVLAHELVEMKSDPDINAWYDATGKENADKCAWNFGATYVIPKAGAYPGAKANMKLGSRDFFIQQNWANLAGAGCKLKYP